MVPLRALQNIKINYLYFNIKNCKEHLPEIKKHTNIGQLESLSKGAGKRYLTLCTFEQKESTHVD